jgi:hypothetical protein
MTCYFEKQYKPNFETRSTTTNSDVHVSVLSRYQATNSGTISCAFIFFMKLEGLKGQEPLLIVYL